MFEIHRISVQVEKDFYDYIEIFLALVTFFLGYWLSNINLNRKEKKRTIEIIIYFRSYLQKQIDSLERYVQKIKDYEASLTNVTLQVAPFTRISHSLAIYEALDKVELNAAIRKKTNIQPMEFMEMISIIEFFRSAIPGLVENHKNFLDNIHRLGENWNEYIRKLHGIKANLFLKKTIAEIKADTDLQFLNYTYNTWFEAAKPEPSLEITRSMLLNPLDGYFRRKYLTDPGNEGIISILETVQRLQGIHDGLMKLYKAYRSVLSDTVALYLKELNDLKIRSSDLELKGFIID